MTTASRSPLTAIANANVPMEMDVEPSTSAKPPHRVRGYEILSQLGDGAYGTVYTARDLNGSHVALKLIEYPPKDTDMVPASLATGISYTPSRSGADEAAHEASIYFKLATTAHHPAVVHIHEFIPGNGFAALALELVDGVLLSDHLNGRAIGDAEAADMARQLTSALAFFHSVGVAHLDLKPENVMRQPDGVLRLIDYGAAATFAAGRLDDAWVEETGGTEAFRAPERLDSVYDDDDEVWDEEGRINGPAADVYSLGVCCFVALTGTDPFDFDGGEDNEDGSFCLVDSYAGMLERLEAGDVFNATSTEGFHIPPRAGAGVSAAAKAFVVSAMRAHPSERPTAAQLEAHAWLRPGALDMAALGAALPG